MVKEVRYILAIIATAIICTTATAQTFNLKNLVNGTHATPSKMGANEFETKGIRYRIISTDKAAVAPNGKYGGDVTIPATVNYNGNTYTVSEIADKAFAGNKKLRTVSIMGNSMTKVGNGAFSGCMFLNCVALPPSVAYIGDDAFHMTNISSIELPEGLTYLGKRAFYFSTITSIHIPAKVSAINAKAFSGCAELTEVVIPKSIKTIAADAFENSPKVKVTRK